MRRRVGRAHRYGCTDVTLVRSFSTLDDGVFSVDQFDAVGCVAPVRLLRLNGGPHSWFGGDRVPTMRSDSEASISSPEAIVEFFDL